MKFIRKSNSLPLLPLTPYSVLSNNITEQNEGKNDTTRYNTDAIEVTFGFLFVIQKSPLKPDFF